MRFETQTALALEAAFDGGASPQMEGAAPALVYTNRLLLKAGVHSANDTDLEKTSSSCSNPRRAVSHASPTCEWTLEGRNLIYVATCRLVARSWLAHDTFQRVSVSGTSIVPVRYRNGSPKPSPSPLGDISDAYPGSPIGQIHSSVRNL
jgi:hypothetical protein